MRRGSKRKSLLVKRSQDLISSDLNKMARKTKKKKKPAPNSEFLLRYRGRNRRERGQQ